MLRIFDYSKQYMKRWIICDTRFLDEQKGVYLSINQSYIYPDDAEEIPPDIYYPKVKPVIITTCVDAYHAHDLENRRSVTEVLMFPNKNLIQYYNRRQNTMETSTYSSELLEMIISTESTMEM